MIRILSALSFAIGVAAQVPTGSVDIGTVGFLGNSTGGGGDWQVSGSGSDIWGSWDHMHYMHFARSTDVTVTCLVNSFTGSDDQSWRKGGIMFRSDLGQRAAHSMIQLTGWGIAHQWRECENCWSGSHHHGYDTEKVWLRLVKEGNTITSFVKRENDYNFMEYHTTTVELGTDFYIGIAITSHSDSNLATLDISNFEISDTVFSLPANPTEVGDTGNTVWVQEIKPDVWSINAAGTGIGGTEDSFGFFGANHTGDVTVDMHLEKVVRRNGETKGGLMIRASNAPDSPHVSLLVKSDDGLTMYWRDAAGGTTSSKNVGVWHEDVELRMVKTGTDVACMYKHASATDWYQIGTKSPALGTEFLVGQALTSADHGDHAQVITGLVTVA